jgi:DNA replication protein DnaC
MLDSLTQRLRLTAVKRLYKEVAKDATQRQIPYEDLLLALLEQVAAGRDQNKTANRIKAA